MNLLRNIVAGYDKMAVKIHGYQKIPGSPVGFFYLVPKVYKGKSITLKDGTIINPKDSVFELHLINTNLEHLNTGYGNLFKMLREELYYVGKYLELEENKHYKGVFGITLLHRLAKRAGFTIIEIENPIKRRLFSLGENILRGTLHKKTSKVKPKKVIAKECWISRDEILATLQKT